jgi:predicted metal-dependent enzyme (double-stranded beta helix superfamily)
MATLVRAQPAILSDDELAALCRSVALRPHLWKPVVRHNPSQRWYERLMLTDSVEMWLIGWWPGQSTPLHDHGGAAGALVVLEGALTETVPDAPPHAWSRGTARRFAPSHIHRIENAGHQLATSVHVYSPPLLPMRAYQDTAA